MAEVPPNPGQRKFSLEEFQHSVSDSLDNEKDLNKKLTEAEGWKHVISDMIDEINSGNLSDYTQDLLDRFDLSAGSLSSLIPKLEQEADSIRAEIAKSGSADTDEPLSPELQAIEQDPEYIRAITEARAKQGVDGVVGDAAKTLLEAEQYKTKNPAEALRIAAQVFRETVDQEAIRVQEEQEFARVVNEHDQKLQEFNRKLPRSLDMTKGRGELLSEQMVAYEQAKAAKNLAGMERQVAAIEDHLNAVDKVNDLVKALNQTKSDLPNNHGFARAIPGLVTRLRRQLNAENFELRQLKNETNVIGEELLKFQQRSFRGKKGSALGKIRSRHGKELKKKGLNDDLNNELNEISALVDGGDYKQALERLTELENDPISILMAKKGTTKKAPDHGPMPRGGADAGKTPKVDLSGPDRGRLILGDLALVKDRSKMGDLVDRLVNANNGLGKDEYAAELEKIKDEFEEFRGVLTEHATDRGNLGVLLAQMSLLSRTPDSGPKPKLPEDRQKEIDQLVDDALKNNTDVTKVLAQIQNGEDAFAGLKGGAEKDAAIARIIGNAQEAKDKEEKQKQVDALSKKVQDFLVSKKIGEADRLGRTLEEVMKAEAGDPNDLNLSPDEAKLVKSALLSPASWGQINTAVGDALNDAKTKADTAEAERKAKASKDTKDGLVKHKAELAAARAKRDAELSKLEADKGYPSWFDKLPGRAFSQSIKDFYDYHVRGEQNMSMVDDQGEVMTTKDDGVDRAVERGGRDGAEKFALGTLGFAMNYIGVRTGLRFAPEAVMYFTQGAAKESHKKELKLAIEKQLDEYFEGVETRLNDGTLEKADLQAVGIEKAAADKIHSLIERSKHMKPETRQMLMERVKGMMQEAAEAKVANAEDLEADVANSEFIRQMRGKIPGKLFDAISAAVDMDKRVTGTSVTKQAVNLGLATMTAFAPIVPGKLLARKAVYAGIGVRESQNRMNLEARLKGESGRVGWFGAVGKSLKEYGGSLIGKNGAWRAGLAWGDLLFTGVAGAQALTGGSAVDTRVARSPFDLIGRGWDWASGGSDQEIADGLNTINMNDENLRIVQSNIDGVLRTQDDADFAAGFDREFVPPDATEPGDGTTPSPEPPSPSPEAPSPDQDGRPEAPSGSPDMSAPDDDIQIDADNESDGRLDAPDDDIPIDEAIESDGRPDVAGAVAASVETGSGEFAWASNEAVPLPDGFEWREDMADRMLVGKDRGHYGVSQLLVRQYVSSPEQYGFSESGGDSQNRWAVLNALERMRGQQDWVDNADAPENFHQTHFTDKAVGRIAVVLNEDGSKYSYFDTQDNEVLSQRQLLERGFARVEGTVPKIDTDTITGPDYDLPSNSGGASETPDTESGGNDRVAGSGDLRPSLRDTIDDALGKGGSVADMVDGSEVGTRLASAGTGKPEGGVDLLSGAGKTEDIEALRTAEDVGATLDEAEARETAAQRQLDRLREQAGASSTADGTPTPEGVLSEGVESGETITRMVNGREVQLHEQSFEVNGEPVEYFSLDDASMRRISDNDMKYLLALDTSGLYEQNDESKRAMEELFNYLQRLQEFKGEYGVNSQDFAKLALGFDRMRTEYQQQGLVDFDFRMREAGVTGSDNGFNPAAVRMIKQLGLDVDRVVRERT